ncbi:alpha/beta fold hydrolase [Sinosporangium siamense]|uniref:alpha/beta fold hydrolase n=1 Tax=Sinosporangium siamense TaxID=1367973 RepID=UPI00194E3A05|nr:alpha/beta fold hydrolase [Sinosporangium siamense]
MSVPVDYANPSGPRLEMAMSRLPAPDRARRIGVLVYNPGGPEAQGVYVPAALWPRQLTDAFDIIGFDPRGVGQSNRVDCGTPQGAVVELAKLPSLTAIPDVNAVDSSARAFVTECEQRLGPLAGQLGSLAVAHDVDAIRRALGEKQLSLWMHSYGSIIGEAYLATYPDRVRAALFTGAVDTATSGVDYTLQAERPMPQPPGGDSLANVFTTTLRQSLAGFAPWCREHAEECPISEDPVGQAKAAARLRQQPAPGEEPAYRTVLDAAFAVSLDPPHWPEFGTAVAQAGTGDPTGLKRLATGGVPADIAALLSSRPSTALLLGAYCTDFAWAKSVLGVLNDYRSAGARESHTPQTASTFVSCGAWPRPAPPLGPLRNPGRVRPLIVNGDEDHFTPLSGARAVASRFNASLLVVKANSGQVVGAGVPCADAAATVYLVNGRHPQRTECGA